MTLDDRLPITVAIPTYRRERVLVETLEYLLALSPPPAEILVLDQTERHEDATTEALQRWHEVGAVRWVRLAEPSIPKAMNQGLLLATQSVVLFLDDDIRPEPDLLRHHVDACERYPDAFTTDPVSIERFNLLDEARAFDYAPLRALDFAREHRESALPHLERVIAQHPGTMLAAAAVGQIIHPSGNAAGHDPASAVLALEEARGRCTEPAAVAQLNLALGGLYCDGLHDEDHARDLFLQAASGGAPAVSAKAQEALARLER